MSCSLFFEDTVRKHPAGTMNKERLRTIFGLPSETSVRVEDFSTGEEVTQFIDNGSYLVIGIASRAVSNETGGSANACTTLCVQPAPKTSAIMVTPRIPPMVNNFRVSTPKNKDSRASYPFTTPMMKKGEDIAIQVKLVGKNDCGYPDNSYGGKTTVIFMDRGSVCYESAVIEMRRHIEPFPETFSLYVESNKHFARLNQLDASSKDRDLWVRTFGFPSRKDLFKTLYVVADDEFYIDVIDDQGKDYNRKIRKVKDLLDAKEDECSELKKEVAEQKKNYKTAMQVSRTMTERAKRTEKDLQAHKDLVRINVKCSTCLKVKMAFCTKCCQLRTCEECAKRWIDGKAGCPVCRGEWIEESTVFFTTAFADLVEEEYEENYEDPPATP